MHFVNGALNFGGGMLLKGAVKSLKVVNYQKDKIDIAMTGLPQVRKWLETK